MSQDTPPATARIALKEWAVACRALGRGEQILLLRKGGISEEHREFRIEHSDFMLYPTFEHQRADLVKPLARSALAHILDVTETRDSVELRYWAKVVEIFEITESEQLTAVSPLHLWTDRYAEERLRWRPRKPLQLVALRVYELGAPPTLAVLPEYGGCKSWVPLAEPIVLDEAQPVLDDEQFAWQLDRVRSALAGQHTEAASA